MENGYYFSEYFQSPVWVQVTKYNHPYDVCSNCGRLLKTVYSVTPECDGLEYLYGAECIKTLKLKKMRLKGV